MHFIIKTISAISYMYQYSSTFVMYSNQESEVNVSECTEQVKGTHRTQHTATGQRDRIWTGSGQAVQRVSSLCSLGLNVTC